MTESIDLPATAILWQCITLFILLMLSALFSATETAFTSLSFLQVSKLGEKGLRGKILKSLHHKSDNLLTTILLGNNLVNIGATALSTQLTLTLFPHLSVAVTTILLTYLVLVFSELTPKRIALANNEFVALNMAFFIYLCYYSLLPFIYIVRYSSWIISFPFAHKKVETVSEEGIFQMITMGTESGIVESYENRMVHNVFMLNDLPVESIMTRRLDVVSLNEETTIEEAVSFFKESHFSRIPVYKKNPENISGIILVKEIYNLYFSGNQGGKLKDFLHEPLFVSEAKKVKPLLDALKHSHIKLAIVLDEYSGLAGIVSQEDIIEAIMGELHDEDDPKEVELVTPIYENAWEVLGETSVFQLNDELNLDLPISRNFKTLAGFLIDEWDEIPSVGMTHDYKKHTYEIIEMNNMQVFKVLITKNKH